MKLRDLIKELERAGWSLIRNGKHMVYGNGSKTVAVPYNKDINKYTAKAILKAVTA